jgi:hypothetical protein
VADIEVNPNYLLGKGETSDITITVRDDYGHRLTSYNDMLTVKTTRGTLSGVKSTVDGRTTRVLTSDGQEGTALITVNGLSGVGKVHFVGSLIDGSFSKGLTNWTVANSFRTPDDPPEGYFGFPEYHASALSRDTVGNITVTPRRGQYMVRLGAITPTVDADTANTPPHKFGQGWISQPVYVEPGKITQLTFWYRILSYDVALGAESASGTRKVWDPFEVYLNGNRVLRAGETWTPEWQDWHSKETPSPKDLGWKQGILDLSSFGGEVVTIKFRVPNDRDSTSDMPVDNTWVYIDDLRMQSVDAKMVYLPMLVR